MVVPYVGTWIEIDTENPKSWMYAVVPYVGTWIEIARYSAFSHPARVVPYVGTWIEISMPSFPDDIGSCRSLRGNVDRN